MPSVQAHAIKTYLRLRRLFSRRQHSFDLARARADLEALLSMFQTSAAAQGNPLLAKGVAGEWLVPAEVVEGRVMLYLHGGGYYGGSARLSRSLPVATGNAAKACVLSIDYRLAPEHPFPAALEDATHAYAGLLEKNHVPSAILLAGDSAGGGLVLSLLLHLRERGLPLAAAAICYSPWTDLALSGESYRANAGSDFILNLPNLEQAARIYLAGIDPRTALASPLYGDRFRRSGPSRRGGCNPRHRQGHATRVAVCGEADSGGAGGAPARGPLC